MIGADDLCDKFKFALDNKWGYIWGKSGQTWTQAAQNSATRPQTVSYGQQWVGRKVADCSGLFVWAFKQLGASIYHGSNTIWNKYCSKQGKLSKGQRCDGIAIRPGTAVFLLNETGRHHIGLYIGGGLCIEAKGTKWGVVASQTTHWDEWGELKEVDYSMMPEDLIPMIKPTLRRGDRGDEVRDLQTMLDRCGYVIAIDGAFGSKTEAAVKGFQRSAGLIVDGVVGPKTWEELETAVGETVPDAELPEDLDDDEDELSDDDADQDQEEDTVSVKREQLTEWLDMMREITDELERLLR